MPELLDADTIFAVSLSVAEWNTMLQILAEQPYKLSAPLINKIQNQVARQQQQSVVTQRLNGGNSVALEAG